MKQRYDFTKIVIVQFYSNTRMLIRQLIIMKILYFIVDVYV